MKILLTLMVMFCGHFIKSQTLVDTSLSKQKSYEAKQIIKKQSYLKDFELNYNKSVFVYRTKDSILKKFITKTNRVLRTQREIFYSGKKIDSLVTFYNERGLPEYIECWICSVAFFDSPEQGMTTFKKITPRTLGSHIRMEYDDKGNEILIIMSLSSGITRNRKIYSDDGQFINSVSEEIEENEFWD